MARINIQEFRRNRTEDLLNIFFKHSDKAKQMAGDGHNFINVHEEQIHAANVIHDLDEQGLLEVAEELYPWERDTMRDYLEVYNEISNGVRI